MRAAVVTDVRGNLPGLGAALAAIRREGCEAIESASPPYPAECLELLLATPRLRCVMGNHEAGFAFGLPQPRPHWMSEGEVAHRRWAHAQIDPALRAVVARWLYVL
jgi:hypothetical protein